MHYAGRQVHWQGVPNSGSYSHPHSGPHTPTPPPPNPHVPPPSFFLVPLLPTSYPPPSLPPALLPPPKTWTTHNPALDASHALTATAEHTIGIIKQSRANFYYSFLSQKENGSSRSEKSYWIYLQKDIVYDMNRALN